MSNYKQAILGINLTKRTIPVLVFLLFATKALVAQEKQKALANYFSALRVNRGLNGTVLIAEKGRVVYQQSFGYANLATKRLNTSQSLFPIMSITKTFTATAILQLQEKGKLNVADPVIKHLPGFPWPTITITHLLSHTSGIPSFFAIFDSLKALQPNRAFTNADILPQYAAAHPALLYQPGENGNYENVNFIFLALVVEKLSGEPYQQYVKKHIFMPAKMTHTFFPANGLFNYTASEKKSLAQTYHYPTLYAAALENSDTSEIAWYWHNFNFNGFGEVLSTGEDLFKYDQALYDNTILRQETLKEVFKPVNLNSGRDNPVGNGLGWNVEKDTSYGCVVFHGGGGVGLSAVLMRNVTKQQTVIIIDNNHSQGGLFVNEMGRNAIKILNGEKVKPALKSLATAYGKTLAGKGAVAASEALNRYRKDSLQYETNDAELIEDEFNLLGYDFLQHDKIDEALATFKKNIEQFPASWNVYDSYAEALLKKGDESEAVKMYKKSIELNPNNDNGKKVLKEILSAVEGVNH